MEKKKTYTHTCFFADTIREAVKFLNEKTKDDSSAIKYAQYEKENHYKSESIDEIIQNHGVKSMTVEIGDEVWRHDSEDEFFADYRKNPSDAYYSKDYRNNKIQIHTIDHSSHITVSLKARSNIEAIFDVFERNLSQSKCIKRIPEKIKKPTLFIGHGGSSLWRNLKDHLQDKHDYLIEAYEVGARAGHAIRDILESMLLSSSFAILVLTAEDETSDGKFHARQNVIHETGLFQGRLGFSKAIVLLEEGAEEFSNIKGIEQIRFSKGNIKETYGEVLATIKREFP